jgi:hypothetical protein
VRAPVEGGQDVQPILAEFFTAEQRAAEVAGSHQEGVLGMVPTEQGFDGAEQVSHQVTDVGFAGHFGRRQVLANLAGVESESVADLAAGGEAEPLAVEVGEVLMVEGQTPKGRFRNISRLSWFHNRLLYRENFLELCLV